MTWSPILLVPFIAIAVVGIVLAVALSSKQSLGMSVFTLFAVLVFATGACLGFLLTNFSSPTVETWWWALAARVGWTCGGAVLLSLGVEQITFRAESVLGPVTPPPPLLRLNPGQRAVFDFVLARGAEMPEGIYPLIATD
jgi:hypothetical protein